MDFSIQLNELEKRVAALEQIINLDSKSPLQFSIYKKKDLSIRELINQLKPATANDTVLIIGYYHEIIKGVGFFTNKDIKLGLNQARIIAPKNISDVIAQIAKKGYIMQNYEQLDRSKTWILTNTGEEYVNNMKVSHD